MKIMVCPLNGPRPVSEFAYGGEVKRMPALDAAPGDWARYVYIERNVAGGQDCAHAAACDFALNLISRKTTER